ncbi:MAG: glycosyltransferase [Acidobacteriota bacterium]
MTDGLRIVSLTAGGAGMFCGSCMRDNALASALLQRGVDVVQVPAFSPIRTDEPDVSGQRVVLGGINVYLEHRWPRLKLPRAVRGLLDHPRLLGLLQGPALQTRRSDDGELALSLLRGERGSHSVETEQVVALLCDLDPHVVAVTNLLICGFLPAFKAKRDVPVTVTLQGDDLFVDSLEPKDHAPVLEEMRRLARQVDVFVTFSEDYAQRMGELFEIPQERFRIVPLGLGNPEEFGRAGQREADRRPTVGYLARLCPEKGFDRLVDAFLTLRELPGMEEAKLRFGGWLGALDRAFVERQIARLRRAGDDAFEHVEIPDRAAKVRFLESLDVLSVPTAYEEPKGLFVLEALAAGVPVVQPAHGSFPELLRSTGGGLLVAPGDAKELAEALRSILADRELGARLGQEGRLGVLERHGAATMAGRTLEIWRALAGSASPTAP